MQEPKLPLAQAGTDVFSAQKEPRVQQQFVWWHQTRNTEDIAIVKVLASKHPSTAVHNHIRRTPLDQQQHPYRSSYFSRSTTAPATTLFASAPPDFIVTYALKLHHDTRSSTLSTSSPCAQYRIQKPDRRCYRYSSWRRSEKEHRRFSELVVERGNSGTTQPPVLHDATSLLRWPSA